MLSVKCFRGIPIETLPPGHADKFEERFPFVTAVVFGEKRNSSFYWKLKFSEKRIPLEVFCSVLGEQGWRSGESARFPPVWPGFDSRTRRHMWVEFVVGSRPCSERFFSGYAGFPLSSKTNTSKFQFNLESVPN